MDRLVELREERKYARTAERSVYWCPYCRRGWHLTHGISPNINDVAPDLRDGVRKGTITE